MQIRKRMWKIQKKRGEKERERGRRGGKGTNGHKKKLVKN